MHIVYVTGDFADKDGDVLTGMPNYIYKIGTYMQQAGHEVSILAVGKENRKWKYGGVLVYSIPIPYLGIFKGEFGKCFLFPLIRDREFNRALEKINAECPVSLVYAWPQCR